MAEPTDSPNSAQSAPSATQSSSAATSPWSFSIPAAAAREVQQVVIFGGTFFSTVIALLASAFGVVAALAWNKAITDWLPTLPFLNFQDTLVRDFAYAGVATFVAVVTILILGFVNSRLKTKGTLPAYPPTQQTTAGAAAERRNG